MPGRIRTFVDKSDRRRDMAETNENLPAQRSVWTDLDPFREFFRSPIRSRNLLSDVEQRSWAPAMDIRESKDGYAVTVELAGANKDDVSVECHDNVLTVKGEKRDEREEQDEHRHYVERSYGSFTRSFRLPADASDDIKASFRDGVLTVEVSKHEEKKPKVVAIDT
jgi:HSP20 family protein